MNNAMSVHTVEMPNHDSKIRTAWKTTTVKSEPDEM